MSKNISPTAFSSKIDENGGKGSRDKSAAIKEAELRGVIRVLINKNQRLQRPVMAARRLAKYYQIQKDEVERMKEVAHNYKTGMERAERRSAQLQYDLARSYNTAAQSKAGNEAASKDIKDAPKGLPFHLPTSARQIIDGLTTDNVRLMKSLQRMSESGEVDLIIKQNLELEEKNKRLQEELDLKSSLLEDYEAEMSNSETKCGADTLARNIIQQRKENTELKSRINSYHGYVKQLREKSSLILDAVMIQLDKANRGPTESVDVEDTGKEKEHVSTATSVPGSLNENRIISLKQDHASHSTGIQTDSGFYSVGSVNNGDMDSLKVENELKNRQEMIEKLTHKLKETEKEVMEMARQQSDMGQTWRQMQIQMENLTGQVTERDAKIRALETAREESEMIVNMMQERVDQVNLEQTNSAMLMDKIKELEEKVSEVPLMQSQIRDFEEDIKAYGIERKQLISKQEQSNYEITKLRDLLRQYQLERQKKPTYFTWASGGTTTTDTAKDVRSKVSTTEPFSAGVTW